MEEKTLENRVKNAELSAVHPIAAAAGETLPELPVKDGDDGTKDVPDSSRRDKSSENKKLDSTSSSKESEIDVGATSSEREALVVENESDCSALLKRSSEEKRLQVQEPIAETMTDKQTANKTLDRRGDSVAETAALTLAHANQTNFKGLSNGNSICGYVKVQPRSTELSTRTKDRYYRAMAKVIVQNVFARIGCYESFVRRASWADEPSGSSRDLSTILIAYSFTEPYEKVQD